MEGTTIQMAAGDGLMEVVQAFVANGTPVNVKDDAGYTAMHAAVSYGHVDVLRYLLSVGGDVNVADEDGEKSRGWRRAFGETRGAGPVFAHRWRCVAGDKLVRLTPPSPLLLGPARTRAQATRRCTCARRPTARRRCWTRAPR